MPRGPNGEKRPADIIGCAVTVMRIATGEIEEPGYKKLDKDKSDAAGGRASADVLTQEARRVVAKKGAAARWSRQRAGTQRKAASRTRPTSCALKRDVFMLAAMSSAGSDSFSPVQVQKLFFLLDKNVAKQTGGPHFAFQPYDYGPFDKDVYGELDQLEEKGLVETIASGGNGGRTYRLTNDGYRVGNEAFDGLGEPIQDYIGKTVHFVRTLSFAELVSAIYQAYPEMKKNSVFA